MNLTPDKKTKRINVTQTFLPPQEEYSRMLDKVWGTKQLTNQGPLLLEFEQETKKALGISGNFHFVTNGTVALQLALSALDITEGEIITTPFTYVATTSAILWERCQPVFVDIDPETLCIDPIKIEAAITPNTKAIMPVHVFGNPCEIEKIDAIAKKHGLKVIYDAAHGFGVKYHGKSLLDFGDISTCSFHATKLFHTIEGGSVTASSPEVGARLELSKRFGHHLDEHSLLGINAKASEFQAAMGLCNLKYYRELINKRRTIYQCYQSAFSKTFSTQKIAANTDYNYAYFPLILKDEEQTLAVMEALYLQNIHPRRYFYPSLNTLPYLSIKHDCPISEDISKRIICLPIYPGLEMDDVDRIIEVIKSNATN